LSAQSSDAAASAEARIAELQQRAATLAAAVEVGGVAALESRIASLVSTLAGKQAALDRALAEGTALGGALAGARQEGIKWKAAAEAAERQLAALRDAGVMGDGESDGGDAVVEVGDADGNGPLDIRAHKHVGSTAGGGVGSGSVAPSHVSAAAGKLDAPVTPPRKSGGGAAGAGAPRLRAVASSAVGTITPLTKLRPIARNTSLTSLADAVDAGSVWVGRFLFRHPAARLAMLAYVALLHLWCLAMLTLHTHALPHDAHGHGAVPAPPAPGVGWGGGGSGRKK
jgi:hypothetical protein